MNLWEFLTCMHPDSAVIIENEGDIIINSKVCDISEDVSCLYWIENGKIVPKEDGILHIPVQHQDKVNREIEKNRKGGAKQL